MLKINQKIENFETDAFYKGKLKKIKLSNYRGEWLVLFFYPADFTFVCPTELSELADLYEEFKKEGMEIISVSCDTAYAHKAWADISPSIKKIKFPMAADPAGKLAKYFGVYIEEEGISLRGTFIIDPNGILKTAEVNDNNIGRSGKELLRKLRAAKFVREHKKENLVCPAEWQPGQKTLEKDFNLTGKI